MTHNRTRFAGLALIAVTATLVGGCAGMSGQRPSNYAASAQVALAKGKVGKAVGLAEQAVLAAPRDAGQRAMLGAAYLKAGRFASATEAYDAALELGDESVPTVLGLALAETAQGHNDAALALLNDWRDLIPASDLGLAHALAGNPARGVAILVDALRNGDNTTKTRQNLAFAYALEGRWREARLMVAQDVAADQVSQRIADWASLAAPERAQARVAHLLAVPLVGDAGQPAELALANFPSTEQLAAEAAARAAPEASSVPVIELAAAPVPVPAQAVAPAPGFELPAVVASLPAAEAPAAPAQIAFASLQLPAANTASDSPAMTTVAVDSAVWSRPVVKPRKRIVGDYVAHNGPLATQPGKRRTLTSPRPAAPKVVANGAFWVQLGSYVDPAVAAEGWGKFTARTPALKPFKVTTTTAVVDGTKVWRVAASGFAAYDDAARMCRTVKSRGGACLVVNAPKSLGGSSGMARR